MFSNPLKSAIWLYFLLLLFEGALRKWVFPGLTQPLLLVRDPVLLVIYLLALGSGRFPMHPFVLGIGALGAVSTALSLAFSSAPWQVTAFGLRATFLHVPLIFVMAAALDREDVLRMGKFAVLLSLPMAVIVFFQFSTPISSPWNITPGGGEAMKSAFDRARASGTFSFATGLASYAGVVSAFLCGAVLERERLPKWLFYAGWFCVMAICVLSASRSVILGAIATLPGLAVVALRRPGLIAPIAGAAVAVGILWFALGKFDIVGEGIKAQEYRFGASAQVEGGAFNRVVSFFIPPWHAFYDTPWHGYGLGMGTNAGAAYISGTRGFGIAEGELHRLIAEMGPLLGGAFLALRYALCLWVIQRSLRAVSWNEPLPILLAFAGLLGLAVGQWGIATSLGFGVFVPGLALAALNDPPGWEEAEEDEGEPLEEETAGEAEHAASA